MHVLLIDLMTNLLTTLFSLLDVLSVEREWKKATAELATAKASFFDQLALTETARQEFQSYREMTRKEVADVKTLLDNKEGHLLLAESKIDSLVVQSQRDRDEIDALRKLHPEMAALTRQLEEAQSEQSKALNRVLDQEKQVADTRRKSEDLSREKRELEEALDCAAAEIKRLVLVELSLRKQVDTISADKAATEGLLSECEDALNRAKNEIVGLKKDLLDANTTSQSRIHEIEDAFERARAEASTLTKKLSETSSTLASVQGELEASFAAHHDEATALKRQLSATSVSLKQTEELVLEQAEENSVLIKQLDESKKKCNGVEALLTASQIDGESLRGQLNDVVTSKGA